MGKTGCGAQGERDRAFQGLQEEIMQIVDDYAVIYLEFTPKLLHHPLQRQAF